MYVQLAVLGIIALAYAAVAGKVEKSWITGPMLFVAAGVILGPYFSNVLAVPMSSEAIKGLAELTLAFVLFNDASGTDLKLLAKTRKVPTRMLVIGLPLAVGAGYLLALWCFPGVGVFELALIATILAPTDAALGKAVVTNEKVHSSIRSTLNVESGLNDGLSVPILFLFLALATETATAGPGALIVEYLLHEVGIGAAVGIGLVSIAAFGIRWCHKNSWLSHSWLPVPVMALAVGSFGLAQAIGGSGFVAAFVGGLTFSFFTNKEAKETLLFASEGIGEVMAMVTWIVFGAVVIPVAIPAFTWPVVLYAILSLTVARMIPIALSLTGTGVNLKGKIFLGWFGPRGLASIVFVVIVGQETLPNIDLIALVVLTTVIMSIFAHGMTANWLAAKWGADMKVPTPQD